MSPRNPEAVLLHVRVQPKARANAVKGWHGAALRVSVTAAPEDGKAKAMLIWLDKKAVHVYSKAKERFGIGDDFASKVLGLLSKKKQPVRVESVAADQDAAPITPLHAAQDNEN